MAAEKGEKRDGGMRLKISTFRIWTQNYTGPD